MIVWTPEGMAAPGAPIFAATDRGAILGDGLFETVRVAAGAPVFLAEHRARLAASAALFRLPLDEGAIGDGIAAVLSDFDGDGALRITLTRGSGGRGLAPIPPADQRPGLVVSLAAAAWPGPGPVRLHKSAVRRNPHAPSCRHKTLSYADAAFARAEADAAGADDALMLSVTGRAACTSIGNLWALTGEGFVTPPLDEGVLAGVVRGVLLAAGEVDGTPIRQGRLEADDLTRWPLYRSNSLMGVQRAHLPGGAAPLADNPLGALYETLEAKDRAAR